MGNKDKTRDGDATLRTETIAETGKQLGMQH